jgi:hypothetical protein
MPSIASKRASMRAAQTSGSKRPNALPSCQSALCKTRTIYSLAGLSLAPVSLERLANSRGGEEAF